MMPLHATHADDESLPYIGTNFGNVTHGRLGVHVRRYG